MSAVQNSRLSFAKIPKVLDIPDLLIIQKDSFKWFIEEGLKEILEEISPIEDFSGRFSLEFLNHYFEEPLKTLDKKTLLSNKPGEKLDEIFASTG